MTRDSRRRLLAAIGAVVVAVLGVGFPTWYGWSALASGDTPANVIRTAALIVGGIVTLVFALWRAVVAEGQADSAQRQADSARQELHHRRFQSASELLARRGLEGSSARIAGLHVFRYLVVDAPDLGLQVFEVVTSFIFQVPLDAHHDPTEFAIAQKTAESVYETMCRESQFDPASLKRLDEDVKYARTKVIEKLEAAGIDPRSPPGEWPGHGR